MSVGVNTPFFKIQKTSADIPVAAALVDNGDTVEEDADVSPVFPNALKTSEEGRHHIDVRQMTLITISLLPTATYLSWTDVSLLIGHTFLPLSLLHL